MKTFDVAVVGAGPAGASAALQLSRRGYEVLLLDKEKGPHHKVCGEFLSGECQPWLTELGLDLHALGAVSIRHFHLHARRSSLTSVLPCTALGLSRFRLDEALVHTAQAVGCHVVRGSFVKDFRCGGNGIFALKTSVGPFAARHVFWATGKHELSHVHRRVGKEKRAIGFKRHMRLPEQHRKELENRVELFVFQGGYAGLALIEDGLANLCFIVDKRVAKSLGHTWTHMLPYVAQHCPRLAAVFEAAAWQWPAPLAIANIPYGYVYNDALPDVYVLGDQFAVIPSLTGDGIAQALMTARVAVRFFEASTRGTMTPAAAIAGYSREVRRRFLAQMKTAYFLHRLFRSPVLTAGGMQLLRPFPSIVAAFVHQTRCQA